MVRFSHSEANETAGRVADAMMFTKEDFKIDNARDLVEFLPIVIFLGLVAPFLIAAYTLGFVMDVTGWLKTSS
ncbi:hypothetical protein EBZ80_14070 [bacterium]|nr:hypothetical protein [bacterium]